VDSEALKTFIAIHRAGGFSNAASALARSQPAISRRISLLEAQLKAPLFERTASGVVLSEAGRTLLPYAERVLATIEDAAGAVAALRSGDAGEVSLAVVGTLASADLTAILKRFAKQFPKVDVALRTATSAEVSGLVRAGEALVGLRYHDDLAPDLVCRPIAAERLVVACARAHRLAGKSVAKFVDLKAERWLAFPLLPGRREAAAQIVHTQFLMRGVDAFAWTPVDSLTAQKRLVEANYGVALVPESAIKEELSGKTLATIRVRDLDAANPIFAVVRKDGYLSPAAKGLIDLLKREWSRG
jgi:DNA-binding transcriptional LysR family regulator